MPRLLSLTVAVLLLVVAACDTSSPSVTNGDDPPPNDDTTGSSAPDLANELRTAPLTPEPIRITVADLPEPFHTTSARQPPQVVDMPDDPVVQVPSGFRVNIYAEGLDRPRTLALTPSGDVLVAESAADRIRRLRDTDGDGAADVNDVFADRDNGLDRPFGMAFVEGGFIVGNEGSVVRYPFDEGQKALDGSGTTLTTLPTGGHWTRNVDVSPEGRRLYVTVGSASNVAPEAPPRAAVLTMTLDGSDRQTFASGLRNPVGLDFHPQTGAPYVTVNERDGMGDDLVPDYFTRIQEGEFFGWPYAYLTPDLLDPRRTDDGESERPDLAAQTVTPDVLFQAHSAALGMTFYDRDAFPARYHDGAFVAFHGSWNRGRGTGYKVVFVPFEDGRPTGTYEDFLTGFLLDPAGPTTWARPVGVLVLPDGSLLVTDDGNGRIFRVSPS